MWLLSGKTHFLDAGGFCILSKAISFRSFQSRARSKGCKWKPTHVNSAVFDGRAILSEAKDEQPHIVLLPSSKAEPKASRAPFQLHWVTAKALKERSMTERCYALLSLHLEENLLLWVREMIYVLGMHFCVVRKECQFELLLKFYKFKLNSFEDYVVFQLVNV